MSASAQLDLFKEPVYAKLLQQPITTACSTCHRADAEVILRCEICSRTMCWVCLANECQDLMCYCGCIPHGGYQQPAMLPRNEAIKLAKIIEQSRSSVARKMERLDAMEATR